MVEPVKPTIDMPLDEALQELTGFEVIGSQKHYGDQFEKLGGIRTLCAAVWAWENRTAKVSWAAVEGRTLRELSGYFAERDPLDEQGKADGRTPSD